MPARRDASLRRWVEIETVVPGTAQQVFDAIATGPGLSAWFTPTRVEQREGGAIVFDFGEGVTSAAVITACEPPHRFAYVERDWVEGAPPLATDCLVTPRASGKGCVFRMTHALTADDDRWDASLERFEAGWQAFIDLLRRYLRDHAGAPAAVAHASAMHSGPGHLAWRALLSPLRLADARTGEHVDGGDGASALVGRVERLVEDDRTRYLVVSLTRPGPGLALFACHAMGGRLRLSVQLHLYGAQAAALAADEHGRWRDWLQARFPLPPATGAGAHAGDAA